MYQRREEETLPMFRCPDTHACLGDILINLTDMESMSDPFMLPMSDGTGEADVDWLVSGEWGKRGEWENA